MTRPFEGIKIIDITHVLAGPFAAYQLGVLGADVIKVENPEDCDQSRHTGYDAALNDKDMGTGYLGTSPGAMSVLIALSLEGNTEPMLIVCFHFFRVVFVILTAPLIFKWISG